MTQPISILLCALGGEGGGVLTDWLVAAARHAGYPVQATSVPGVAQRTGATTYYLELLPTPQAELNGQRPVFGLNPLPGRLDVLVSSELLETARQVSLGYSTADRTLVLASGSRTLTTQEKMKLGDGRLDDAALVSLVQQHSRRSHVLDMAGLTREAGTVVSAVMLGALAASEVLPMQRADYEAVLTDGREPAQCSPSQRASLRGFALAWDAVQAQQAQARYVEALQATAQPAPAPTLPRDLAAQFPPEVHETMALALARVNDYQGARYAELYVQRLQRLRWQQADTEVLRETARWLALWMCFDDIVRVADLKSRASRWQRVREEVRAGDDDVLRVYDHFKPGVPEFAALLPLPMANALLRHEAARVAQGRAPRAWPIRVASHRLGGWLMLRLLASLKWLRPHGHRYAQEQAAIEQWLAAIELALARDASVALALARCGQLIKGYGSTHMRGFENLQHILLHLASGSAFDTAAAQAQAIDQARQAALQDEAGQALNQVLQGHGLPRREPRAQPIRWMRRPVSPARQPHP